MSKRPIIYFGDERLTTPSQPVLTFDTHLAGLVKDMFETMYDANGIGLALPQLGINFQVMVIDITQDKTQQWCFINPKIVYRKGENVMEEACLSIPGASGEVRRAESIKVQAQDQNNMPFEIEAHGLFARCIQHEYDHLQGKLFIDYLSSLKRQRAIEQYLKMRHRAKKRQ